MSTSASEHTVFPMRVRRHRIRRLYRSVALVLIGGAAVSAGAACTGARDTAGNATARYVPRTRTVTITTVPLMVKEQEKVLPFLAEAFGKGGVLEGKEVYAFEPSTVTVVEGDTIRFTLINPEDDVHSFVLPDLAVSLPGMTSTTATYVAKRPGIFPFVCAIQSHLPMMSGQLVVLSAAAMAGAAPAASDSAGHTAH
jgi:plastocyanin